MRKRLLIIYHTQGGHTGAMAEAVLRDRIATGYGWKRVAEPLIARNEVTAADLAACEDLGEAMASGVALGIF